MKKEKIRILFTIDDNEAYLYGNYENYSFEICKINSNENILLIRLIEKNFPKPNSVSLVLEEKFKFIEDAIQKANEYVNKTINN